MKSSQSSPCTFCGTPHANDYRGGEWHGPVGTVYCCAACATAVVPVLIADSIHLNTKSGIGVASPYHQAGARWPLAEKTFWKALTSRLSGALKP